MHLVYDLVSRIPHGCAELEVAAGSLAGCFDTPIVLIEDEAAQEAAELLCCDMLNVSLQASKSCSLQISNDMKPLGKRIYNGAENGTDRRGVAPKYQPGVKGASFERDMQSL